MSREIERDGAALALWLRCSGVTTWDCYYGECILECDRGVRGCGIARVAPYRMWVPSAGCGGDVAENGLASHHQRSTDARREGPRSAIECDDGLARWGGHRACVV